MFICRECTYLWICAYMYIETKRYLNLLIITKNLYFVQAKIKVSESAVCTKCICDTKNSLLDCTDKMDKWFSPEEWEILQDGDVTFETIKLSHNNFTDIPVLPIYGVKNLYLDYNNISSIALGAFQNLTELSRLDLANNMLTAKSLVPDVFQGPYSANDYEPLKNLKSLNLGYNLLHSLNDDLFEHVPNLEELILCSNSFNVIDKLTETAVSGLISLKVRYHNAINEYYLFMIYIRKTNNY